MTKEQEKKIIDLKVRQQLKQAELERAENDEQLATITAEIESIKEQIQAVEDEVAEIKGENEEIIDEERKKMENVKEVRKVSVETAEERAARIEKVEKRAKELKEGRSITVASSKILVPDHQATELQGYPFKPVSSFIDHVNVKNLDGGETHQVAFVKDYAMGGLTAEGADYTDAEPTFGYATVAKAKITAYAELSEEVHKLPACDYEKEVMNGLNIALRKKMSEQAIKGAGATNTFKGITAASVEALKAEDKVELSAITPTSLDEIIYSYGGDEEVLGGGVLVLNKLDLKALAMLRDDVSQQRLHKIDYANQTIDGIPYIINSNLPALSASGTAAGTVCMLFGAPKGYEIDIFSPVEVMKSTDFKFKQGIVCYKASVFAGGNVTSYRSFLLVKKA